MSKLTETILLRSEQFYRKRLSAPVVVPVRVARRNYFIDDSIYTEPAFLYSKARAHFLFKHRIEIFIQSFKVREAQDLRLQFY